ncbi:MAG TPA: alpha/beta hydrolase [Acidimicrobiales bacterium]|nr:alpha/beta hydrolase [Acidimicrobiales bacterium]
MAHPPAGPGPAGPGRWPPSALQPRFTRSSDGVDVAFYDLGGHGPALLLMHATGFCGPALAPMAGELSDRFRSVAVDERAHGRSAPPTDGDFSWSGFALDALAVVDELGLEQPVGFGHSCGAAALLLAEQARPGTFAGLYLFEPVVYPSDVPLAPSLDGNPLSGGALRRRSEFPDRHGALANFSSKAPFDVLDPAVLAAYVDNGFHVGPGGELALRCRREDEAQVYAHGFSHDAYSHLDRVRCPVTLACGADTDAFGPSFLDLFAARLAPVEQVVLPGLGHFGPLEDPSAVARSVRRSLAAAAATSAAAEGVSRPGGLDHRRDTPGA